jgi:hypothetical protein
VGPRSAKKYTTQTFNYEKHGSQEEAIKAAKKWQKEKSLEMNLTKNCIRIVEDETPYLEVQMQNGMVMKCDPDDIDIVEGSIWTAWRGKGKKCFYARRRPTKDGQKYAMFHTLLCPEYSEVDHINRDGLDNRRANLREGKVLNSRNKGIQINNTSGITGVYYRGPPSEHWIAQIGGNKDYKRRQKSFSIKKYGEEALQLAIKTRKEWERELRYGPHSIM